MIAGGDSRSHARAFVLSAAALPIAAALFVVFRYYLDAPLLMAAAQVLYVGVPAVASVAVTLCARAAPQGTRSHLAWLLLAVTMWLLTALEVVLAAEAMVTAGVTALMALSDVLAAGSTLLFFWFLAVSSSLDRLSRTRVRKLGVDLAVVSVTAFVVAYRFLIAPALAELGLTGTSYGLIDAAYLAVGVVVMIGTAAVFRPPAIGRMAQWSRLVGAGIGLFGLAVTLYPTWHLAYLGLLPSVTLEAAVAVLYFIGYGLIGLGALSRYQSRHASWESLGLPAERGAVWPDLVGSTSSLGSIFFLAGIVFVETAVGGTLQIELFALVFVSGCLILRTALTTREIAELQSEAVTDPVTGAFNPVHLHDRLDELLASTRRFGEPFLVAWVNLDDFSAVNRTLGAVEGDRLLRLIASTLSHEERMRENVFRVGGDQFVVIMPAVSRDGAGAAVVQVLDAIKGLSRNDVRITASIGYALCPEDSTSGDELLWQAANAQAWAKRHGKDRITAFSKGMGGAFDSAVPGAESGGNLDIARALSAAADARDPANYRHSRNVAALSVLLARELELSDEHVRRIEVAAMLHDVGKIALPDGMLGDRTLSIRERNSAREHSDLGGRLVESLGLEGVADWVRAHHERWDGQGYPDGSAGELIPLEARIIALADAYDAMTTGRRYGAPMSKAAALQEVDLGMGSRFDPRLAERFVAVVAATDSLGWSDTWTAA